MALLMQNLSAVHLSFCFLFFSNGDGFLLKNPQLLNESPFWSRVHISVRPILVEKQKANWPLKESNSQPDLISKFQLSELTGHDPEKNSLLNSRNSTVSVT